ncbi:tail sheath [Synechococcus phage S-H9-1]|uniref:Tail sheath monomer n=1 Tax=Synechococcus phage S-H9-1 TaxID=2783674 RepID=A0A873WKP8_9CAUD|nr:tail sheath [Synechococcus phage S-H9-1]QPB08231.1 tail sheath monomer [Synechococcus phage S-H9-1]
MASQVSPGVVIRERDLSNAVVVGDVAITAAFASTFAKGPVGVITNINSERELIDTFGGPSDDNASDWLVASEYLQYGGRLAVVRAETGVLNATATGSGVLIKSKEDFDGGVTSEVFAARFAGTDGNYYRVVVVDRGADEIATVVGHGLTAGATYNDGTNDHEVYAVLGVDTIAIINTDGVKASANGVSTTPWYSNTTIASTGLKLSAIGPRPGTSVFASENYLNWDEMHVAVIDERSNTIVERFTYVSKLSDAVTTEGASNYWRDVVNLESQYIYSAAEVVTSLQATGNAWGGTAASYAATSSAPEYMKLQLPTGANGAFDGTLLSGGTDDYVYTAGEIQTAYNEFLDTEASEIDFVLMGGSMASEADTKTKAGAVIGVATSRTDCVAFVSPHVGNQIAASGGSLSSTQQRDNTIAFFDTLPSTSFAVFDSGIKYTYDRFADKYRYVGCNGDIAGLCVRTSRAIDDWISPAGLNRGALRNVVKLAYNPNKADRDELYQSRVNPVVSFPGSGPVLFGDKTALASPSAFDRINVRRLFLNIEKRAGDLGKQVLFEQNDAITRGGFTSAITSYLAEVQARRGLTDYLVVCDESNNTPAVIDRNEFVAELYLKPTRSINYVTVTVTATRTGVEFSEVVGR